MLRDENLERNEGVVLDFGNEKFQLLRDERIWYRHVSKVTLYLLFWFNWAADKERTEAPPAYSC